MIVIVRTGAVRDMKVREKLAKVGERESKKEREREVMGKGERRSDVRERGNRQGRVLF